MATQATQKVPIELDRNGGALIRADVFIYSNPTSTSPQLVGTLHLKDFLQDPETQTISLAPGLYAAKSFMTLSEGINSDFDYTVTAGTTVVAELEGDVKKLSATNGQPDPLVHTRFFTV